ncbi:histidine kinase [Aurantivibrio infirmus]
MADMNMESWTNHKRFGPLNLAAMIAWLAVSWFIVGDFPLQELSSTFQLITWIALAIYFLGMHLIWGSGLENIKLGILGRSLMLIALLALTWFQNNSVYLVLTIVFAGNLPYFLSLAKSCVFIIFLHIALSLLWSQRWHDDGFWFYSLSYLGFSIFALFSSYIAKRERKLRHELDLANNKLVATQRLLTESAIESERLRIARDLHDSLGHHLTALSLQLEVAHHVPENKVKEHVDKAQALTKLLLSDVRQVVTDMRSLPTHNFRDSIEQMIASSSVHIELDMDANFLSGTPVISETFYRLCQEIITNSNRHSKTKVLKLSFRETDDAWQLRADDSSTQHFDLKTGAGIKGMRERVEHCGGTFNLSTGSGFSYQIVIPKP